MRMRGVHGAEENRESGRWRWPNRRAKTGHSDRTIVVAERLGGLLRHYRWEDAA